MGGRYNLCMSLRPWSGCGVLDVLGNAVLPKVNFLKIEQMPTKCGPLLGSNADQMGTKMPTNADLVSVHTHIEQK